MFVTLTSADIAGEPIENTKVVAEEMERWLREMEGFEGFLMLARDGNAVGLVFWADREIAEKHRHSRTQFRERMLSIAGVTIEEVADYELSFARLGPGLISAGSIESAA